MKESVAVHPFKLSEPSPVVNEELAAVWAVRVGVAGVFPSGIRTEEAKITDVDTSMLGDIELV